ncbi:DNA polymerase III subunit delta [Motiliproteus coralliicola]|uniref:DNA polymerase III subunit delta n=1 Tax=Motiliproteus coralliicola TaxID=2283196 RepID=A0A369WU88_9GAMM|nr:DNA polymerase III subunit delta [Motiliproteus coralliicola]RDE24106.1 DNA polymerase III subunit delta [Motiliproteus coralliicola]
MKLKPEQLGSHLKQPLQPVYLLTGDEPLLVQEAGDQLRAAARQQGFSEREVFHAEPGFSWDSLLESSQSLSLFAERRLIELHIPNGKPGTKGAETLNRLLAPAPEDTLILIYCPRLDASAQRSSWFKAIDKAGAILQFWPVEANRLPGWIQQRCRGLGLSIDPDAAQLLADRVEGNLLAAVQEIEKLKLLSPDNSLSEQLVGGGVANNARYDTFALVDAALAGNSSRCLRVLQGLRGEGVEPIQILGSLSWEVRKLSELKQHPGPLNDALFKKQRIFGKRQALVGQALKRLQPLQLNRMLQLCAAIDQSIKGMCNQDPWQQLAELSLQLCGQPCLADLID